MNTIHKSMETNQVLDNAVIRKSSNYSRFPRGRKIPKEFIAKAKIKEGKNTISAVAKAYGVHQQDLSSVIRGKRNTAHLIQILETEYGMSISEIRDIWKRNKDRLANEGEKAQIDTFGKVITPLKGE